MPGILFFVPTPLNDTAVLDSQTVQLLLSAHENADLICIEDAKVARRKWLAWGLPREAINNFELFNEHNHKEQIEKLIGFLLAGKNVWLMSDGGLPGFCDPGKDLAAECHRRNIRVSATNFANSAVLALAMSGFSGDSFLFLGFPPVEQTPRGSFLSQLIKETRPVILMDTPYRMIRLLEELSSILPPNREVYLATNLNLEDEWCMRGPIQKVCKMMPQEKREFVLVIDG